MTLPVKPGHCQIKAINGFDGRITDLRLAPLPTAL